MPINTSFIPACMALVAAQTIEAHRHSDGPLPTLVAWMMANSPVPVSVATDFYSVVVLPGREITVHTHPEAVLLYYPAPQGIPVITEGVAYCPEAGELVYMAPNVPHSVPVNTSGLPRVTIAVKVA